MAMWEYLLQRPVAVLPGDVLAPQPGVDLEIVLTVWAGAPADTSGLDPAEDRVEFALRYPETDVVTLEALALGEVERQAVVDEHRDELPERLPPGHVEQRGEALGASVLVAGRDDCVIELNRHP